MLDQWLRRGGGVVLVQPRCWLVATHFIHIDEEPAANVAPAIGVPEQKPVCLRSPVPSCVFSCAPRPTVGGA